jgi:class 3 adenylate cyclase/esterase/lipase
VDPTTGYAVNDGVHIAYQVMGDGDLDIVWVPEWWNSMMMMWEEPSYDRFLRSLASMGRLVCFDKRGNGLSDPVSLQDPPALEERASDVAAVLAEVGSKQAAIISSGGGGVISLLFAATYPEYTRALVVLNGHARLVVSDDYPWGAPSVEEDQLLETMTNYWGQTGGVGLELAAPSMVGDPRFEQWWERQQRLAHSPATARLNRRLLLEADLRGVLSMIQAPTLIISRSGNRLVPVEHSRYLADHIPGSKYVEFEGEDQLAFIGDSSAILGEIQEFLTGERPVVDSDRVLATVLFTDIVDSTGLARQMGDRRWRDVLAGHDQMIRRQLERFRGRELNTTGDGFLALFDGPARAIRCAVACRDGARQIGLELRAGVHTGEVEVLGDDIGGIAMHVASRVMDKAEAGEILVSGTVKDLVVGSGISLSDRGAHALKGLEDEWRIFSVDSA